MLFNTLSRATGASALTFSANFTNIAEGVTTTTYTIPSSGPLVGDLAVIHYTTVQGSMAATPSGWTQVSLTSTTTDGRQIQRVMYKILTSSDLGSVLTLATTSSLSSTYSKTRLITFTPSRTITGINISSLHVDADTLVARTKNTSTYSPPNIIFAAGSSYNGVTNGGYDETYWNQEYITAGVVQFFTAYEIQNTANIDRTITPAYTGQARINHTFVINAVV